MPPLPTYQAALLFRLDQINTFLKDTNVKYLESQINHKHSIVILLLYMDHNISEQHIYKWLALIAENKTKS